VKDLREFIQRVEDLGEYKLIEGADWNLEIGTINAWQTSLPSSPMLLFDKIKGYPSGYRVVSNLFATERRTALALGLPLEAKGMELVKAWRDRLRGGIKLIPPVEVKTGPLKENIQVGDEIDLFKFPTPKWHEFDGGRYIGTGNLVITRDPDEGWVNLGTYRVQVHDKNMATIYMSPGRHADIMRRKYWAKGESCPVVVTCGQDPMLFAPAGLSMPWGMSEYDYTGWIQGAPVEVTKGVVTDLPIPATAEIALEGEIMPPEVESIEEGPFGEWTGYYASAERPEPTFRVKAVLHRNDPIIQGNPPTIPYKFTVGHGIRRAAMIWDELERHLPGVKGAWLVDEAQGPSIAVVSIKQMYPGHAKQAAMVTAGCSAQAYLCRWIIVVDDDIDPSNITEVIWCLGTRTDPESVEVIRGCWGSLLDPMLPPEKRERGDTTHSTGLIFACKPYHWRDKFPRSIKVNPELIEQAKRKWAKSFE